MNINFSLPLLSSSSGFVVLNLEEQTPLFPNRLPSLMPVSNPSPNPLGRERISSVSSPNNSQVNEEQTKRKQTRYRKLSHLLLPPVLQGLCPSAERITEEFEDAPDEGAYCVYQDAEKGHYLVIARPEIIPNHTAIHFTYSYSSENLTISHLPDKSFKSFDQLKKHYSLTLPLYQDSSSNPLQNEMAPRQFRTSFKRKPYNTQFPKIFSTFFGFHKYKRPPSLEALRILFQNAKEGDYKVYITDKKEEEPHGQVVYFSPNKKDNPKKIIFRFRGPNLLVPILGFKDQYIPWDSFEKLSAQYKLKQWLPDEMPLTKEQGFFTDNTNPNQDSHKKRKLDTPSLTVSVFSTTPPPISSSSEHPYSMGIPSLSPLRTWTETSISQSTLEALLEEPSTERSPVRNLLEIPTVWDSPVDPLPDILTLDLPSS